MMPLLSAPVRRRAPGRRRCWRSNRHLGEIGAIGPECRTEGVTPGRGWRLKGRIKTVAGANARATGAIETPRPAVEFEDVWLAFDERVVLRGVSVACPSGR
jgi:hypothetical protein